MQQARFAIDEVPARSDPARQGRYVLGELLGRGGMAEVFAGHVLGSHGFQKPVAIKRLLPELATDHVFVERLISEAKLLVGMTHGNIVSVLDLAREHNDVFLVMEYVDGPSLRQLLKARGSRRLSLGTATYIVQAAAAGLEFAHARPGGAIIHADISPSNLLLTTSGEVRVADFGIAQREGRAAGAVEGKWAYMPPEQVRGEPLTPRSDVFSLGVVLYELITGHHPFGQSVTPHERDSGPIRIPPPRVLNPAVPIGLDAICMKALAEHARDRYARMQHLIDAIIDERFAQQWREGANDLMHAIREIAPGTVGNSAVSPRTQHTDCPVTIITGSLINQRGRASSPPPAIESSLDVTLDRLDSEATLLIEPPSAVSTSDVMVPPAARTPVVEPPSAVSTSGVIAPPLGVRTRLVEMPEGLPPMPLLPPPQAPPATPVRIPDTLARPYRMLTAALPELLSQERSPTTLPDSTSQIDVPEAPWSRRTFAVLGIGALIGVIAAIAIQLASSDDPEIEPTTTRVVNETAVPTATVEQTPAPVVQAPTVLETPTPAQTASEEAAPAPPR